MEKLFAKIKKESLSKDEKAELLSVLQNFVSENPARSIKSPFYDGWFVFKHMAIIAPAALLLMIALTGGTFFATRNSLPGDTFYPVKMLKENVESFVAIDAKAKTEVEVSHAITRLQEIEQLVTLNKQIGEGESKQIGDNFGAQVEGVVNKIQELRNKGNEKDASTIWSDFKKSVAKHEKTITDLSNSTSTKDETRRSLGHVVSNIQSRLKKTDNEDDFHEEQATSTATSTEEMIKGEVKGEQTDTKATSTERASFKKNRHFQNRYSD